MEEAAARKERLKALKAAQQLVEQGNTAAAAAAQEAAAAEPEKPVLKFRNYTVKDEKHIEHEKVAVMAQAALLQQLSVAPQLTRCLLLVVSAGRASAAAKASSRHRDRHKTGGSRRGGEQHARSADASPPPQLAAGCWHLLWPWVLDAPAALLPALGPS
jgi:hypothetical protein